MMKDAYEVLEQKEADLTRVRQEIESLRIVASLLVDDPNSNDWRQTHLVSAEKTDGLPDLEATGTEGLSTSVAISRSGFWSALKRAR
jgi:hypothetical protein